jgi:hypothetical protein
MPSLALLDLTRQLGFCDDDAGCAVVGPVHARLLGALGAMLLVAHSLAGRASPGGSAMTVMLRRLGAPAGE